MAEEPSASCSASGEPPSHKKPRLNADDLVAREELGEEDEDWVINDRFDFHYCLGAGAYGTVFKAVDRERKNQLVALKKVTFLEDPKQGVPLHILREVQNLKFLHKNCNPPIVRLLDVVPTEGRFPHEVILYLVFEHMEQDLDSFIRSTYPVGMKEPVIRDFLHQILAGVLWMHANNIVHRDLKPQNILVTNKTVKIADFGLSRVLDENTVLSTQVVTQWYRAPEVLLHSSYSKAVDIWSVGCIMAEMFLGRPLFASKLKGEKAQLEEIFSIIGTPPASQWPTETFISSNQFGSKPHRPWAAMLPRIGSSGEDLLSAMLTFKADKRPTAEQSLAHKFFYPITNTTTDTTPIKKFDDTPISPSSSPSSTPFINHTHSTETEEPVKSPEGSLDSGIHDI